MSDTENSNKTVISDKEKRQDMSLYNVGDEINGIKIKTIYASSADYIFYWDENDRFSSLRSNVPNYTENSLAEYKRLRGLAHSYLSKKHFKRIDCLLTDVLISALRASEELDIDVLFKESREYIEKYKNEIKEFITKETDFEIFINTNDEVEWYYPDLPYHLIEAVDEFQKLKYLARVTLPESQKYTIANILGSSLAIAFRKQTENELLTVFNSPKDFIFSQIKAEFKRRFFSATVYGSIILTIIFLIAHYPFNLINAYANGAELGVLGAMISSLQRNNQLSVDPYNSSIRDIYCVVATNLLIGLIFGGLVILIAESGVALTLIKDNQSAMMFFSFIAGFSERFVPDLIATVSDKATHERE